MAGRGTGAVEGQEMGKEDEKKEVNVSFEGFLESQVTGGLDAERGNVTTNSTVGGMARPYQVKSNCICTDFFFYKQFHRGLNVRPQGCI